MSRRGSRLGGVGSVEWCFRGVELGWLAQKVCRKSWMLKSRREQGRQACERAGLATLTLADINSYNQLRFQMERGQDSEIASAST